MKEGRKISRNLEGVLVEVVDADGGRRSAGRLLGGDDGDGVGWVGRADLVLGHDSQVIGGGGSQIEHTGYVLLGSGHQNPVDISLPRAFADLVFDHVALDRAVSVVGRRPGQLNRSPRLVQHLQTVWNLGNLCGRELV